MLQRSTEGETEYGVQTVLREERDTWGGLLSVRPKN